MIKEGKFWVITTVTSRYVIATFRRDVGRRSLHEFLRIAGDRYIPNASSASVAVAFLFGLAPLRGGCREPNPGKARLWPLRASILKPAAIHGLRAPLGICAANRMLWLSAP